MNRIGVRPVPYVRPEARRPAPCVCGAWQAALQESMCRLCRKAAVGEHGRRLEALLSRITYDHGGVQLVWSGPGGEPAVFTPRVHFTAPDVLNPPGGPVCFLWFEDWADD